MHCVPPRSAPLLWLLTACTLALPLGAQTSKTAASDTRASLVVQAHVADSLGRRDEAFRLRSRLRDGDFEVGDNVLVKYEGVGLSKSDSLVVQAGRVVRLGEPLGDLNLTGVLRSEVSDSITARVAQYFRNEVVHVTPLLRLQVSGAAKTPGFYQFRPDLPLSDAIMKAGGQGPNGNFSNVTIKRGERVIWTNADVQSAFSDGLTLEQLELEPGDEIAVGGFGSKAWLQIVQYSVPVLLGILLQRWLRP